ncbi:DUF3592 domain-containing protein [Thermomonospora cellulosilytica]|uniref:DUF3592 domain-containing protein n=1 Tax=Thermomonospora cellulosilytica TaxID=1411118 RepID=A0A7W3RAD4_9ACTN|nr:DUF3592 domain-containing protein [Thermomonospora cellulosilytica]MBA9005746.1 hypothetical protein [Thermomonospora cellulosilytica]
MIETLASANQGEAPVALVALGTPGLIFAVGAVLVVWETLSDMRLDRVAVLAPDPGEVVREEHTRGERRQIISHIRFTTLEGEEVVARIVTGRSVSRLGRGLRVKYDPADPGRAALVREPSHGLSIVVALVFGGLAALFLGVLLIVLL